MKYCFWVAEAQANMEVITGRNTSDQVTSGCPALFTLQITLCLFFYFFYFFEKQLNDPQKTELEKGRTPGGRQSMQVNDIL